jgi:arsenate reductase (thioredoxin)
MAEGFLRNMAGDRFDVYSSGVKPSHVNPLAIRVMAEVGIDISGHTFEDVQKYLDEDFDTVITVCDRAKESCPIFPGAPKQVHWSFYDPAEAEGTETERLTVFLRVRDEIQAAIREWLVQHGGSI